MPETAIGLEEQRSGESSGKDLPANIGYTGGFFRSRGFYFGIILFILLLIFIFIAPVAIPAATTFVGASAANAVLFYIMNIVIATAISPLSAYVVFRIEKWWFGEPKTQRTLVVSPSIERGQRNIEGVNDDLRRSSPHVANATEVSDTALKENSMVACGDNSQERFSDSKKDVEISRSVDITGDEGLSFEVVPGTGICDYLVLTLGLINVKENGRVSVAAVKKAYRTQELKSHPDREKVLDKKLAEETFRLLEKKSDILDFFRQLSRGDVDGSEFSRKFDIRRHIKTAEDVYIRRIEAQTADLRQTLDGTGKTLDRTEKTLDGTEKRLDVTEKRLDGTEKRLDGTEKRLDRLEEGMAEFKAKLLSERLAKANKISSTPLPTENVMLHQVPLPSTTQIFSAGQANVDSEEQTQKSNPTEEVSISEPAAAPPNVDSPPSSDVAQQHGDSVSGVVASASSDTPDVPQPVPSGVTQNTEGLFGEQGRRRPSVSNTVPTLT
jgi:hypothetical protein